MVGVEIFFTQKFGLVRLITQPKIFHNPIQLDPLFSGWVGFDRLSNFFNFIYLPFIIIRIK